MPLRTLRIDINPLWDFRYVAVATRYAALDMFASQTRDLYHIETDRKGGYIEWSSYNGAKYIEPSQARHIDN